MKAGIDGIYEESGLHIDLSEKPHFRFENLTTYATLSGQNVKEMDFVFSHEGQLYFLEVKNEDFSFIPTNQPHLEKQTIEFRKSAKSKFDEKELAKTKAMLAKTLTDAILMMAAVWLKTEKGKSLLEEGIPSAIATLQPFTLILALNLPNDLKKQYSEELNTAITAALKGYASLYDSKVIVLFDYDDLIRYFPFIQKQGV